MTFENCKKYLAETKDEVTKKFWADRIARKYPTVEEKTKKVKKEKVEVKE